MNSSDHHHVAPQLGTIFLGPPRLGKTIRTRIVKYSTPEASLVYHLVMHPWGGLQSCFVVRTFCSPLMYPLGASQSCFFVHTFCGPPTHVLRCGAVPQCECACSAGTREP